MNDANNVRFLEYLLLAFENKFSPADLNRLNQAITKTTKSASIRVSSELINLSSRLATKYSKDNQKNVDFIYFVKQLLETLTNNNHSDRASFPDLDDLITLVELKNNLQEQEALLADKTNEKIRLQTDCNIDSITKHPDARAWSKILAKDPNAPTVETEQHRVYQDMKMLEVELIELNRYIAELKRKIIPLQERLDHLNRRFQADDYQKKYPLHQAVHDGNIREIVRLLLDEDHVTFYNKPDDTGFIPLHHAYLKRNAEIFQLLYEGVGPTAREKEQYKKLILREYEMIKNQKNKGPEFESIIREYRAMAMPFKNPYHQLWNNISDKLKDHPAHDAQRVINIFKDYYALEVLSFLRWDKLQRILAGHWHRSFTNLAKAKKISKQFNKYLISINSSERVKHEDWESVDTGINRLNALTADKTYDPEESFEARIKYVVT